MTYKPRTKLAARLMGEMQTAGLAPDLADTLVKAADEGRLRAADCRLAASLVSDWSAATIAGLAADPAIPGSPAAIANAQAEDENLLLKKMAQMNGGALSVNANGEPVIVRADSAAGEGVLAAQMRRRHQR